MAQSQRARHHAIQSFVLLPCRSNKVLRQDFSGCDFRQSAVHLKEWFAGLFYEPFQDLLSGRQVRERGIYNVERIRQDIALHREGKLDVSGAAFNVMQYETWSGFLKQHTSRQGQN